MVTTMPRIAILIKSVFKVFLSKVLDSYVRIVSGLHSKTPSFISVIFFFFSLNFIEYLYHISGKTAATATKVGNRKFTWKLKKKIR